MVSMRYDKPFVIAWLLSGNVGGICDALAMVFAVLSGFSLLVVLHLN
jgi:hypothetical protein